MSTLSAQIVRGLLKLGYKEEPSNTRRHRVFTNGSTNLLSKEPEKLFLGTHGGLRKGPCISRSYSVQPYTLYQSVLAAGKEEA